MTRISQEDKRVWDRIVAGFCAEHGITEAEFTKIIAYCYRGWGNRSMLPRGGGWKYTLKTWAILDCTMRWSKLKREFNKSIRLNKKHLACIDSMWDPPEDKVAGIKDHAAIPSEAGFLPIYDNRRVAAVYEDLLDLGEEVDVVEADNLLYGVYEED